MSVDHLITELKQRNLLSDRMLDKLREAVADPARPLSARALAKLLVQKQHLTQLQATNVIHALLTADVDVDAIGPPSTIISTMNASPISASELDNTDPEDEGSSIFAPFVKNAIEPPPPTDDDDDLTLVAIEDEDYPGESSAATEMDNDEDLPAVGLLVSAAKDRPPSEEDSAADVGWTVRPPDDSRQMTIAEMDARIVPAPFDDEKPAPRRAGARLTGDGKDARKKAGLRKKKNWDSPLILYGGGGLALMLLIGVAVLWILNWEKGDQELSLARDALDGGAYAQAIEHYEHFLENSPRHPELSQARVQLAMARIRQATEAGSFSQALELAPRELEAVEDEEDFDDAHGELASLLPQIATGLAKQAETAAAGADENKELIAEARTALELCNNVLYIPKTLRDEGQLNVVRELLRRVEHREQSHQSLQDTLAAMDKAISDGDTAAAYTAHTRLVSERLELLGNAKLAEMIARATAAEEAAVKFVREEQAAETSERPTPWIASLALAQRHGGTAAPAGNPTSVACVRVEGAVYGLDTTSGKLLWRRQVGLKTTCSPTLLDGDVLVADARHNELLRLNSTSGKLVWRQSIGEPFGDPLVVGTRAFLAANSGRLYIVDLASGARSGYLQFPQPLSAPATTDRRQEKLYLAAAQFSLYTISLSDLKCLGAFYLGHELTSVQHPPALVLNRLAILENDSVETSRLRLFSLNDRGAVAGQEMERRLTGLAAAPLLVEGRRLMAVTDRGRFDVYEVTSEPGEAALAELATREATDSQPIVRYVAVADGHIWVADTRLTKHEILPTGNRLPVVSIANNFAGATFDHPLQLFGTTLIHVRRPQGGAGVVVGATDISQGRSLWDTDLAVPPASAPIVDQSGRALVVANANGFVFRFDEAAIRSRVQDEPLVAQSMPAKTTPLTAGVDLGRGRAAFFAPGSDQLLLYNPAETKREVHWIKLPSPLACAATPLGDGLLAPLKIGQVFYLNPADGRPLATPFQPKLQPRTDVAYRPAGAVTPANRRFVITDGQEKIYLVHLVDQPQPHFESAAAGTVSPDPIVSPITVLDDLAIAATAAGRIARFKLPSLESTGETNLSGEAVWGPFRVGDQIVLATADEQLVAIAATGDVAWTVPLEHGELAGPPLASGGSILLAYRKGIVERRDATNGKLIAQRDVQHPLAAGPVAFARRIVLTAHDGTLLVVDQP